MKILYLLTFPGVIFHELSHMFACKLFKIKIIDFELFTLSNDENIGWVSHEKIYEFFKAFFISFAPFIFLTLISILFLIINQNILLSEIYLKKLFFWLSFSTLIHAVPSTQDIDNVITLAKQEREYNIFIYLSYPFTLLMFLLNRSGIWFWIISFGILSKADNILQLLIQ